MPPILRHSLHVRDELAEKFYDSVAYFSKRAPRYQAAIRGCPAARSLDLIPYLAVLSQSGIGVDTPARACDAFGGTGFLARSLSGFNLEFAVVDACTEMLAGVASLPRVEPVVTNDDFESTAARFGPESFDLVFCHGGLHHVVGPGEPPAPQASRGRQSAVVARLARLVRPGGVLVVADIPEGVPSEAKERLQETAFSTEILTRCFSRSRRELLARVLGLQSDHPWSLTQIEERVGSALWQPVQFSIPRHYFDEFVAKETPMGHVAVFPEFEELHETIASEGHTLMWRINYRGPWIFESRQQAGWFFREKFSLFDPGPPGADPESEERVFKDISRFLGTSEGTDWACVNWGVTYAAYVRG